MKKILLLGLFSLIVTTAKTQVYDMVTNNGEIISACSVSFKDNISGNYMPNVNQTITFHSDNPANTHVKIIFSAFDIDVSDTLYVYDGSSEISPLIGKYNNSYPLSGLQNIVQSSITNTTGTLSFKFVTNGNNQKAGWLATLECIKPCQRVIASVNTILTSPQPHNNTIDVCLGIPVNFVASASFPDDNLSYHQTKYNCIFRWDFGDASPVETGYSVIHNYDVRNSYNIILTITDSMGCVSTNSIGTKVRTANMPVTSIQSLPDMCTGNTKLLSVGYNPNSVFLLEPIGAQTSKLSFDSTFFLPDGPVCLPGIYNTYIEFDNFPNGASIQTAEDITAICVNMEHSYAGDLGFRIVCPNGQNIILDPNTHSGGAFLGEPFGGAGHSAFDNGCLSSNNIPGAGWNYCWSELYPNNNLTLDQLSSSSGQGTILVNGSRTIDSTNQLNHTNYIKPQNPFSGLVGCPFNGIWNIEITDDFAVDNGYIFNWSLQLQNSFFPVNWTYDANIDTIVFSGPFLSPLTDTSAIIAADTAGNFTYTISITDVFGCIWDTTTTMTFISTPQPHLGSDTALCYPNTIVLNPGNIATTYLWNTPTGIRTTQAISTDAGYATIPVIEDYMLIASNTNIDHSLSCSGMDTIRITQNPSPYPSFATNSPVYPLQACAPYTISFINESSPSNLTYLWDFGDGQTSTMENPTHIYAVGNFEIGLSVTTINGCTTTWFSGPNFIISSPVPATPVVSRYGNILSSNFGIGNQWYNLSSGIIYNATTQNYIATQIGKYFTIVSLNGCRSDSSNIISLEYIGIQEETTSVSGLKLIPNPFSMQTTLSYCLAKDENVDVSIMDLSGKELFKLVNEKQSKGEHSIVLNASQLSAGIYFYKLKTRDKVNIGKIILQK